MKKLFYLLLTSFFLFSCNPHKSKIINDWNLISINTSGASSTTILIENASLQNNTNEMSTSRTTLDLKKDGTFKFESSGDHQIIDNYLPFYNKKGKWSLDSDILSLQFTNGKDEGVTLECQIIEEKSKDRFTLIVSGYRISTEGVSVSDMKKIMYSSLYFVSYSFEQAF